MKSNRVAENLETLNLLSSGLVDPVIARNILLMDISSSLSVIADELTRRDTDNDNR